MAKTKTSFTSETARVAGKVGGKSLLGLKGKEYFRRLAKKSWKNRTKK